MKLNLGSGHRNLEGYCNVDLRGRHGVEPDLVADVSDLRGKVEDASCDEVLAVHVIEHFPKPKVAEVLKEWVRVLKPGGLLAVECPDALKCASNILIGHAVKDPQFRDRMGILGFFGEGGDEDPLMLHHWAWTPDTLGAEFHKAGLEQIQSEKPHFKYPQRDMRITGRRPKPQD